MISKIKITENNFDNFDKNLMKAYPFLNLTDHLKKIKSLVPGGTKSISFELRKSSTAMANAIRTMILDEITWPRLTCAIEDIETDDAFAKRMTDYIQSRIWLIPTSYADKSEYKFKIDFTNKETYPVIVKSSEIKQISGGKLQFSDKIDVIELKPGKSIKIDISVEWGKNAKHASFSKFHYIKYAALDIDIDKTPSYSVYPTDYLLGFSCEEYIDPMKVLKLLFSEMLARYENALEEVQKFENTPYKSEKLNVRTIEGDIQRYEFYNESYAFGNMISWYIFCEDPSIDFVNSGDEHPEDKSILVNIKHPAHKKIMIKALEKIIKDIGSLERQI